MQALLKILLVTLFTLSGCGNSPGKVAQETDNQKLWISCKLQGVIAFEVFNTAITGYNKIDGIKKKDIVTIIDYSKPSTEKRFYVIDIRKRVLLYNCLVAHGKNSGDNVAVKFSNQPESLMSSLGFFITAETYFGKHGYSLRLDGLEKSFNDNARMRDIVIHGADYVSQKHIDNQGRLGRSWGCPALPPELSKEIIDNISDGSCLFIYGIDSLYHENSQFINLTSL